jgi:hypothetical protein
MKHLRLTYNKKYKCKSYLSQIHSLEDQKAKK